MEEINSLKPDWDISLKVWWSLFWRQILYCGVGAGIIGGVLGVVLGEILKCDGVKLSGMFGFLSAVPISIWIVKTVLNIKYKDFKIVIVAKNQN